MSKVIFDMKAVWLVSAIILVPVSVFANGNDEWECCYDMGCEDRGGLDDEYCACLCDVHPYDAACIITTTYPETTLDGGEESDCPEGQTYIESAHTGDKELLDGTGVCCSNVVSITNLGNYEGDYENVDRICCDNPTSNTEAICDMGGIVGTESGTPETTRPTLPTPTTP